MVNVGATALWAWSRTAGLPWKPYNGVAESIGSVDLTCVLLQAIAITLAVGLLLAPDRFPIPMPVAGAAAIAAVAVATIVASAGGAPAATSTASGGGGHGHNHSHGGAAAAAAPTAGSNEAHAAEMLAIDRAPATSASTPRRTGTRPAR